MLDSFRRLSITLGRPDLQPPLEEELGLADLDSSERPPLQLAPTPSEMLRVGAQAIEDAQLRYKTSAEALLQVIEWSVKGLLPLLDAAMEAPESPSSFVSALKEAGIETIEPMQGTEANGREHEEVARGQASPHCPPGHVLRTIRRGYKCHNVVLRKAQVVVAISAQQDPSGSGEGS